MVNALGLSSHIFSLFPLLFKKNITYKSHESSDLYVILCEILIKFRAEDQLAITLVPRGKHVLCLDFSKALVLLAQNEKVTFHEQ